MLNAESARQRIGAHLRKAKIRYELGDFLDFAGLLLKVQAETLEEAQRIVLNAEFYNACGKCALGTAENTTRAEIAKLGGTDA